MHPQPPTIVPTDGELLMRFTAGGDEEAFRLLVERHAPLVHSVCRRVLVHHQDVEDAFQATFLVLARRAASIRCRDSVVSWLFKVAHRTAVRAVREDLRRAERPLRDEPVDAASTLTRIEQRETFETLAAELNRLPESYRAPLILFYLEGKSRRAAAEELDLSEAALKARLAHGRRLLRQRLMRRGVALSLAMTAAASASTAEAALPAALIEQTVTASLSYAAGANTAACSTHSVTLARGVQPMLSASFTKPALAAAALICAGLLVVSGMSGDSSHADNRAGAGQTPTSINTVIDAAPPATKTALAGDNLPAAIKAAGAGREPVDLKTLSPAEQKIEEKLLETTEVEFLDTSLKDALAFISQLHDITIIIDNTALSEEGIATDEPITQVLSGVSLESTLNIILTPLELTYLIEDDVMKITTNIAAKKKQEMRVYLVKPLIDAGFDAEALKRVVETQSDVKVESLGSVLVVTQSQPQHRKTMDLLQQLQRAAEIQRKQ